MSEHELSNKELSSYLVEINSQEAAELPAPEQYGRLPAQAHIGPHQPHR